MANTPERAGAGTGGSSPDWRQLAVVALAALALVVAAFAVPPLAGGDDSTGTDGPPDDTRAGGSGGGSGTGGGQSDGEAASDGGSSGGGGTGDGGTGDGGTGDEGTGDGGAVSEGADGGDGGGDGFVARDPDGRRFHPDQEPPVDPADVQPKLGDGCWVVAHSPPVPGTTLQVSVWRDHRPLADRRVWFNEDLVGLTNDLGTVAGTVPYESEFEVAVAVRNCQFLTADPATDDPGPASLTERAVRGSVSRKPAAEGLPRSGTSDDGRTVTVVSRMAATGSVAAVGEAPRATGTPEPNETVSNTYELEGDITIEVTGRPYPGSDVSLAATLGGHPVADGRVIVDSQHVGRTSATGHYRVTIPEEARETITVRVERGDFSGTATVPVHDLRLSLVPARPLPVPGQEAVATVTVAGDPVADADVVHAGTRLGETDANGSVGVILPADPTATVRATASGQAATAPVWPLYVPTALVLFLTLGAGLALTVREWRSRGRSAALRRGAVAGGLSTVLVGYVLGGRRGAILAAGGAALLTLGAWWWTSEPTATDVVEGTRDRLRATLDWLRSALLRGVDVVAALVDRGRALVLGLAAWLAGQPRSLAAILRRLSGWLRSLPGRVGNRIHAGLVWLRREASSTLRAHYGHRRLAAGIAATAFVGAASWRWGTVGGLAAGILLAAFIIAVLLIGSLLRASRTGIESESGDADGDAGSSALDPGSTGSSEDPRRSLRQLWRRFAQAVEPGSWRTRTPVEIARTAVDSGLPAEPVVRLTEAFRAVEYGGRDLSEDDERRARAAYRTVRDALRGDGEAGE